VSDNAALRFVYCKHNTLLMEHATKHHYYIICSLCMETEQIGNNTLSQMGRQREQITNANVNIERTKEIALQAKAILTDM
jgi:hypothetical protein